MMRRWHQLHRWLFGGPTRGERYDAYVALITAFQTDPPRVTQPGAVDRHVKIWPRLVAAFVGHRLQEFGRTSEELSPVRPYRERRAKRLVRALPFPQRRA